MKTEWLAEQSTESKRKAFAIMKARYESFSRYRGEGFGNCNGYKRNTVNGKTDFGDYRDRPPGPAERHIRL